jgi:hypothetical protein
VLLGADFLPRNALLVDALAVVERGLSLSGLNLERERVGPTMDDLERLNRTIAYYWLGHLDADQEAYLAYASMCVGRLTHSASELAELLKDLKQKQRDPLYVGKLNRRYLRFGRLAAKEAAAGRLDLLVRLGISLEQADLLRNLTDDDLDRLAFGCEGPIIQFASQAFGRGAALHFQAGRHHATAFVAARLSARSGERS